MTLDFAVSRAVAQSQLLEAALHSPLPWFLQIGGVRRLAAREVHARGVTFTACFDGVPEGHEGPMFLVHGDTSRSARPFTAIDDGPFCVTWDVSLAEAVPA